ncbi:MAG: hypothetical protein K0Q73_9041 [Paenibacillus sp.]|jgi:hypothetical protein|nr:hypothetical protein [Paenibacillus sp.]
MFDRLSSKFLVLLEGIKMILKKILMSIPTIALIISTSVACSKGDPDYVGYVVDKSKDKITIVASTSEVPPFVLISDKNFHVGSKVEVRLKDSEMNTMFPSTAKADISEVKTSAKEKDVLEKLLTLTSNQNGSLYYSAVLSVKEQSDDWIIETKEHGSGAKNNEIYSVSYKVTKENLEITIINKIKN